jgi:hypothetical protein
MPMEALPWLPMGPPRTSVPDLDLPLQPQAHGDMTADAFITQPASLLLSPAQDGTGGNAAAIGAADQGRLLRRISRPEWDAHRQTIETQYPLMTLPQLKKHMAEQYQFTAR